MSTAARTVIRVQFHARFRFGCSGVGGGGSRVAMCPPLLSVGIRHSERACHLVITSDKSPSDKHGGFPYLPVYAGCQLAYGARAASGPVVLPPPSGDVSRD